jgi:hypothetical protein
LATTFVYDLIARYPTAQRNTEATSPTTAAHPLAVLMNIPAKTETKEPQRRATTSGTPISLAATGGTPSPSGNNATSPVATTPPRRGSATNTISPRPAAGSVSSGGSSTAGTSGTTPAFFTAHLLPSASEVNLLTTIDPTTGQSVAGTYVLSPERAASSAEISNSVAPPTTTTPTLAPATTPAVVLPTTATAPVAVAPANTTTTNIVNNAMISDSNSASTSATSTTTNTPLIGTPRSGRPSLLAASSIDTTASADGSLIEFPFVATAANSPQGSFNSGTGGALFPPRAASTSISAAGTSSASGVTVSATTTTAIVTDGAGTTIAATISTSTTTTTMVGTGASITPVPAVVLTSEPPSTTQPVTKRPGSIIIVDPPAGTTSPSTSSSTPRGPALHIRQQSGSELGVPTTSGSAPPTPLNLPALNTNDTSPMFQSTQTPMGTAAAVGTADLASPSLSFGPPRVEDEPDSPVSPSQPHSFSLRSFDSDSTQQTADTPGSHSRKKSHGHILREQREKEAKRAAELTEALAKMLRDVGDAKFFNRVLQSFIEENGAGLAHVPSTSVVSPGTPMDGSPAIGPVKTTPDLTAAGTSGGEPDEMILPAATNASSVPRVLKLRESNRRPGTPMGGEITTSGSNDSLSGSAATTPMHHPRTTSMLVTSSERKEGDIDVRQGRSPSVMIGGTSGDKPPGLARALSSNTTPMAKNNKSAMSKMKGLFGKNKNKKMVVELEEDEHMTLDVHCQYITSLFV